LFKFSNLIFPLLIYLGLLLFSLRVTD